MQIIPKESTKTNLTDCSVFAAPFTLPNDEKLVLERASVDTVSTLNFPLFPPEKKYFLSLIIVMFSLGHMVENLVVVVFFFWLMDQKKHNHNNRKCLLPIIFLSNSGGMLFAMKSPSKLLILWAII